jgi:hypothetical protein
MEIIDEIINMSDEDYMNIVIKLYNEKIDIIKRNNQVLNGMLLTV